MAIYTVHVPRGLADPFGRADKTTFVRDGFSVWAFLFGPLYFMRHRAFAAAAAWIVAVLLGAWLCRRAGLPQPADVALALLVAVFTGLEASSLRRFTLHRRGLDVADVVGGRTHDDSERAFFLADTMRPPADAPTVRVAYPSTGVGDVIGSFPGT